jgi:hypothetical protein
MGDWETNCLVTQLEKALKKKLGCLANSLDLHLAIGAMSCIILELKQSP